MQKNKWKLFFQIAGVVLAVCAFGFVIHRMEGRSVPVQKSSVSDIADEEEYNYLTIGEEEYAYDHELETYLLIGTDASGNVNGEGEEYQGNMADFLLLVVWDKTDDTYGFLQLNRDTMAEVTLLQKDGTGYASAEEQICTAHWYGKDREAGCENTVEAVSNLLGGLPIDGYYEINMEEIPEINHALGGVEVTLEEDFSEMDEEMTKGKTLTLSDEQAYIYLRGRYGVGDEENTSRMERQRQYMQAAFQKMGRQFEEAPESFGTIYNTLLEHAVTDISGKMFSRLAKGMSEGENKGIFTLDGEKKTGQALDDGLEHAEFYPEEASIVEVLTELCGLE